MLELAVISKAAARPPSPVSESSFARGEAAMHASSAAGRSEGAVSARGRYSPDTSLRLGDGITGVEAD
jgi:hypothetical protein